jgi:hypothetical protein
MLFVGTIISLFQGICSTTAPFPVTGFTEVTNAVFPGAFPGANFAAAVACDFYNDGLGHPDLAIQGSSASNDAGAWGLWLFAYNGTRYVNVTSLLPANNGVCYGVITCNDIDNDGDLDLYNCGETSTNVKSAHLFVNQGGTSGFVDGTAARFSPALPQISDCGASWYGWFP